LKVVTFYSQIVPRFETTYIHISDKPIPNILLNPYFVFVFLQFWMQMVEFVSRTSCRIMAIRYSQLVRTLGVTNPILNVIYASYFYYLIQFMYQLGKDLLFSIKPILQKMLNLVIWNMFHSLNLINFLAISTILIWSTAKITKYLHLCQDLTTH
jgi:hypothetical protein